MAYEGQNKNQILKLLGNIVLNILWKVKINEFRSLTLHLMILSVQFGQMKTKNIFILLLFKDLFI